MNNNFVEVIIKGIVKSIGLTPPNEVVPLQLTPSFLLEDSKKRVIAIDIGDKFFMVNEALKGGLTPYNVFVSILEKLKIKVNKILIYNVNDDLRAKIHFQTSFNETFEEEIDVCDAITISILAKASVYVDIKTIEEFSADISKLIG
ncbi:MAG: DUF151 domain-containing protein [Nitrososphaeria archaeon]